MVVIRKNIILKTSVIQIQNIQNSRDIGTVKVYVIHQFDYVNYQSKSVIKKKKRRKITFDE